MKILVYGLGQFGYALLRHLHDTLNSTSQLYGYDYRENVVEHFSKTREHLYLYPGHKISKDIHISGDYKSVLPLADVIILAVPSNSTLDIIPKIETHAKEGVILVNTAKALDYDTGKRLSVIYRENLLKINYIYTLFTGGTIARDLFTNQLLGAVVASENLNTAKKIKRMMESDSLRINTTSDVAGVEYASAFKNVISIMTGFIHGKGFGYGSETYILTRIALEVEKLIIGELNGKRATFSIGSQAWGNDMFMSATGKTRNREFGILLGKGLTPKQAVSQMEKEFKTVEGIKTLHAINKITKIKKYKILNYLYSLIILEKKVDFLDLIRTI